MCDRRRELITVTVLNSDPLYPGLMSQTSTRAQLWAYRLSVSLDSLYPITLDFIDLPGDE